MKHARCQRDGGLQAAARAAHPPERRARGRPRRCPRGRSPASVVVLLRGRRIRRFPRGSEAGFARRRRRLTSRIRARLSSDPKARPWGAF